MNIQTLEHYVEQKNRWAAIFGSPARSLLNPEDRKFIADEISMDLSPENLTLDGELSAAKVRQKRNYLIRCALELQSIDPSLTICEA